MVHAFHLGKVALYWEGGSQRAKNGGLADWGSGLGDGGWEDWEMEIEMGSLLSWTWSHDGFVGGILLHRTYVEDEYLNLDRTLTRPNRLQVRGR